MALSVLAERHSDSDKRSTLVSGTFERVIKLIDRSLLFTPTWESSCVQLEVRSRLPASTKGPMGLMSPLPMLMSPLRYEPTRKSQANVPLSALSTAFCVSF